MKLNIGDDVLFRKDGKLYKGKIKSFKDNKVEIDDSTIELIVAAISRGTIAESLLKTEGEEYCKYKKVRGTHSDILKTCKSNFHKCVQLYPCAFFVAYSQEIS